VSLLSAPVGGMSWSKKASDNGLRISSFSALSLSYNGGKDCLVLLILYLAVLHTHFSASTDGTTPKEFPLSIPSIYAKPPDPFPAVSEFVEYSSTLYHLDLTHISTNPGPSKRNNNPTNSPGAVTQAAVQIEEKKPIISFRDAFAMYLSSHPSVRAIFVGTRRTDPHGGHLTHFDPTDHNWPDFMRIHPVIDWTLSEVWCFLRSPFLQDLESLRTKNKDGSGAAEAGILKVQCEPTPLKYCSIYDEGYTSLGGVNDTVRNPKLRYVDSDGREKYKPAHQMTWDEGERLGRE
jgi:FAD synthetase